MLVVTGMSLQFTIDKPLPCKEQFKFQNATDFMQGTCLFWDEEKWSGKQSRPLNSLSFIIRQFLPSSFSWLSPNFSLGSPKSSLSVLNFHYNWFLYNFT